MTEIHGTCKPEFEAVRTAFAANFEQGSELGASACVTRHGETVVDIWAATATSTATRGSATRS